MWGFTTVEFITLASKGDTNSTSNTLNSTAQREGQVRHMVVWVVMELDLTQTSHTGGLSMANYRCVRLYRGRFHHHGVEVWLLHHQHHPHQYSSEGGSGEAYGGVGGGGARFDSNQLYWRP